MSALDVVVLTSGKIGIEVAAGLAQCREVNSILIVTAPVGRGRKSLWRKGRDLYRLHGPRGILDAALRRVRQPRRGPALTTMVRERCPRAEHWHVLDLHDPAFLDRLRARQPDLGVVAATYILKPALFTIPRLGSVNLHFGRAPDFRGSSPAFYEMLQGVPEVGVTVHRVTETLDGGNILLQRTVPLDLAPAVDPVAYLQQYQWDVLVPVGTALMTEAVRRIADGTVEEWPQDPARARTYKRATYALKRELRRIVAARRGSQ